MPFLQNVVDRSFERANYCCEVCGSDWKTLLETTKTTFPLFAHSATTFHLDRSLYKPDYYIATSVPNSHKGLLNKLLVGKRFLVYGMNRPDDAFVVCKKCHILIHKPALVKSREVFKEINGYAYKEKNALSHILEQTTLNFVIYGPTWTP